jgi:hypothetical protein
MPDNIQKINPAMKVPDYLKDAPIKGVEELKKYVTLNRLKIIHKASSDDLLALFNPGDVIVTPTQTMIAPAILDKKGKITGEGTPWLFVPLFFYVEYCTWEPLALKGQGPMISARSFDMNSSLARKARDPQLREEPHPNHPDLKLRHVEHLNFIVTPYNHPLSGEIMVMTYDRGNYYHGQKFSALIGLRKASPYHCVFEATLLKNTNDKGSWQTIVPVNPEQAPWVTADEAKKFEELYDGFDKIHKESRFQTNYETESSQGTDADSANAPETKF